MTLSTNRLTDTENRHVVPKGRKGWEGWTGNLGLAMQTITYKMDK